MFYIAPTVLLSVITGSLSAVLFDPNIYNPFVKNQQTTRAPIVINPMFYHIMPPGISLSTSGQTTTESTTTTASPTTLPPNFCRTSADCPLSSCCRDLNQKVLVMSEVFDATGPYRSRTPTNGTCSNSRAQLGEQCNDFCACEIGMTCFRDVNKPCCEPAVCQYQAALEKSMQVWMRCFEDDRCEVFEDDSSSEEDDDSDESLQNSTSQAVKKFKVPTHLVPTVRSMIAKQNDDDDDSDESDETELAKLLNNSLIQNLTRTFLDYDGSDSEDNDSESSEEEALAVLLQGIINHLLNSSNTTPSPISTTVSPISTTESLLGLFYNPQTHTNTLLDTKLHSTNHIVDVKQLISNHAKKSNTHTILNSFKRGQSSPVLQSQQSSLMSAMGQLQGFTNSETMKTLHSLQANNILSGASQSQPHGLRETTTLDPLTALIAESIASQLMIPMPAPSPQLTKSLPGGQMKIQHQMSGGGMFNLNINSNNMATTTPVMPDLGFIAGNIDPNNKLAPQLKRLQLLLGKKKASAAQPVQHTFQRTSTPIPQMHPVNNFINSVNPMTHVFNSAAMNPMTRVINSVAMNPMTHVINSAPMNPMTNVINSAAMNPMTHIINSAPMNPMTNVINSPAMNPTINNQMNNHQQLMNVLMFGSQTAETSQNLQTNKHMKQLLQLIGQSTPPPPQTATTTTANPSIQIRNTISNYNTAKALHVMKLLKFLKKKKANRRLKKAKKSKSSNKFLHFNKMAVNSLGTKDSSTRSAFKHLQSLRLTFLNRNTSISNIKTKKVNATEESEESDESDESDEMTKNSTLNFLYALQNQTIKALKVRLNESEEDDDSDDSDEEIDAWLAAILIELGKKPNLTQPISTTTTPSPTTTTTPSPTTTTTTAPTTTTTTTVSPTTVTSTTRTTPSTTVTTSIPSTTTMNIFLQHLLKRQSTQNTIGHQLYRQNALQTSQKIKNKILDLKSLAWNDVVNYFKTKKTGI
ncbi:probable serine/threonine-protein kinase dyrk2 isoform X2 [Mytilus edulis]|uniref:probable serine/threonine-protein kinase dyrk2 isoform X2 n=1 Tax=Mytilus edulis TaxID=6550 RepID=UPI0039EFD124